jgi:LacI family transcriptional regulator
LRIPEDIAVAGCGNVMYAEFLRVPLTTVDQDSEAIGERAGKLVLSLLESKTRPQPKTILLEPKLIVRESSLKHAPLS